MSGAERTTVAWNGRPAAGEREHVVDLAPLGGDMATRAGTATVHDLDGRVLARADMAYRTRSSRRRRGLPLLEAEIGPGVAVRGESGRLGSCSDHSTRECCVTAARIRCGTGNEPTLAGVPPDLRTRMDAAELFHEVLEHRWFLSEAAGRDVGMPAAVRDYVDHVLPAVPGDLVARPPTTVGDRAPR